MDMNIKRNKRKSGFFGFLFFMIYVLSNSIFILFDTTSLRNGMIVSILFLIFVFLALRNDRVLSINKKYFYGIIAFHSLLFMWTLISVVIYGVISLERAFFSIILLLLMAIISPLFINLSYTVTSSMFHSAIKLSYNVMNIIGFLSITLQQTGVLQGKNMIIFKEPSHFSIVYLPLAFYAIYVNCNRKIARLVLLILGFSISFLIQNLTLLVGMVMIFLAAYWNEKRKIALYSTMAIVGLLTLNINKLSYFIDRLNISFDSRNLSVLSWISGWERAYISLVESFGFGVGFQRMGFVGLKGSAMNTIYEIMGGSYLNLYDGSSLAPKIVTEMGLFGLFILFIYLYNLLRVFKMTVRNYYSSVDLFFAGVYLMFSIQLFVRGVGYFSPTSFLFAASIYWLFIRNSCTDTMKHSEKNVVE